MVPLLFIVFNFEYKIDTQGDIIFLILLYD